jgi:hypothetical protein
MVKIEDVTTQILEGTLKPNEADKQKKFKKTSPIEPLPKESWQENKIVRFMKAITYFCNRNFSDVRLLVLRYINR